LARLAARPGRKPALQFRLRYRPGDITPSIMGLSVYAVGRSKHRPCVA
jgi:hypothetical protein